MVDEVPVQPRNDAQLPKYLDVNEKLSSPQTSKSNDDEWALFRDNNGRVVAQLLDLITNEEKYANQPCEPCHDGTKPKKPELVLVVSTDMPDENCGDHFDITEPELNSSDNEELFSFDGSMLIAEQGIELMNDHTYESEFFPCVRKQWYIRPPVGADVLTDGNMIVNTSILANDVRIFLKNNSISIENFAKLYMKRTQGTVSDLLNHPKKWQELSKKGRETYVKLMEFLSDAKLASSIKELRSKHAFTCPDRLPTSLLNQIKRGVSPSDKELSNIAVVYRLKVDTLKRYCQQHVLLQRNLSLTAYGQHEEHISDILGQYICGRPGCGTILQGKDALKLHLDKNCENQFYCLLCQQYFKTQLSFDAHFEHCHKPFMVSKQPPSFTVPDVIPDNDFIFMGDHADAKSQKFICGVCWCGFKSRQRLTKHLSIKHKVGQKNLRPGITCFVCFKVLKNLNALDVHMRTHTKARPFPCNTCKAAFQTKANLQRHIKTHTGEKPYACTYCESRFIEEKALTIHMRTHTGEKPFQCNVCNKRFIHKTPLKLHMLIHEGKKPHACEFCGKRFRQKINLQVHMKRHRGSKKYKCASCELSFITKTDWNRHNMMHTGEKPFQCQLCSKSFTRNVYLQDHLKRLSNQTAPQCDICEKRFCNDAAFKRHRKTHVLTLPLSSMTDQKLTKDTASMDTYNGADIGTANSNIFLLSTKSNVGNDRQYFVMPIQSMEGNADDDMNRLSLQPVLLSQNEDSYSLPFTTSDGQPLLLQCVDLSGTPQSLFGQNGEFLSTLKDVAIPITFSTEESTGQGLPPILETIDPNMQSTVNKIVDDTIILNEEGSGNVSDDTMKLDLSDNSQIIESESQQPNHTTVMVIPSDHVDGNNLVSQNQIPVGVSDVILPHDPKVSAHVSRNQSYVIVDSKVSPR